jgi:hypothetical protein
MASTLSFSVYGFLVTLLAIVGALATRRYLRGSG